MISVYFEANVSSNKPQGFNASFWVRRCQRSSDEGDEGSLVCPGGAQCQSGLCQCPQGYGGPHCDRPICSQDCGIAEGRGACNTVSFVMIYVMFSGFFECHLICCVVFIINFTYTSTLFCRICFRYPANVNSH